MMIDVGVSKHIKNIVYRYEGVKCTSVKRVSNARIAEEVNSVCSTDTFDDSDMVSVLNSTLKAINNLYPQEDTGNYQVRSKTWEDTGMRGGLTHEQFDEFKRDVQAIARMSLISRGTQESSTKQSKGYQEKELVRV